jgi:hypothetical protein
VVDKPAEEAEDGHGHHGHAHWENQLGAPLAQSRGVSGDVPAICRSKDGTICTSEVRV